MSRRTTKRRPHTCAKNTTLVKAGISTVHEHQCPACRENTIMSGHPWDWYKLSDSEKEEWSRLMLTKTGRGLIRKLVANLPIDLYQNKLPPRFTRQELSEQKRIVMQASHDSCVKSKRYQIYERDGFACLKCNSDGPLTLDHIVPKFHGGGNGQHNLQTLCEKCNGQKGRRIIDYRRHDKPKTDPRN